MFVVRIPLFIALVVGTSFIAKAVDYILPTGVTVLTEEQLLTIIIGNTTTGKNSVAGKWAEYYEPSRDEGKNGEIRGKARRAYYGQWKINGSLMCLDFDGINSDACYTIAFDGSMVTYYNTNGKPEGSPSMLILGNPNGF